MECTVRLTRSEKHSYIHVHVCVSVLLSFNMESYKTGTTTDTTVKWCKIFSTQLQTQITKQLFFLFFQQHLLEVYMLTVGRGLSVFTAATASQRRQTHSCIVLCCSLRMLSNQPRSHGFMYWFLCLCSAH